MGTHIGLVPDFKVLYWGTQTSLKFSCHVMPCYAMFITCCSMSIYSWCVGVELYHENILSMTSTPVQVYVTLESVRGGLAIPRTGSSFGWPPCTCFGFGKASCPRPRRYIDGSMLIDLATRVKVRVETLVHPCRVKSFRKAMPAVMDDLEHSISIIDNYNQSLLL